MFLAEPPPTAYDLRFSAAGFPVRVTPFFFVVSLVLIYEGSSGWARAYGLNSPGLVVLLWTAVVFVSTLVHEMGHGLAMRRYGIDSSIVLYHFGGLAISRSPARTSMHPRRQIFISAAGPGIELVFAAALVLLLAVGGYEYQREGVIRYLVPDALMGERPLPPALELTVVFLLYVNVYWALLNLVPVYPLDGGNISREIFLWLGVHDGIRYSLALSLVTGVAIAFWAFSQQQRFLGFMFAMLAFSSFQTLQAHMGGGRGRW